MRNIANVERYSSVIINSFNPSKLRDVSLRLFWLTMTISTFFVQLHRTMMSEKQLELFVLIRYISLLSYLPLPSFILSVSGITSQNEIDTLEYKFWCPNIFKISEIIGTYIRWLRYPHTVQMKPLICYLSGREKSCASMQLES